jgi:endonuclease YncB( thermonuclease family)
MRAAVVMMALALSAPVMPSAMAQNGGDEIVRPANRNVTPPGITPGPPGEGPLVRVPVPPRPPEPPRWRRFFLPVTDDAATFKADGKVIHISGVAPPKVDQMCRLADGTDWPCGRTALYSLRMFLHGRAVECLFPFVEGAADIVAPCRVGGTDLGGWLLTQGWAAPDELATDTYRALAEAARCAGRGMWRGAAPPTACAAIN